jgi:multidrug resistance efflux pump
MKFVDVLRFSVFALLCMLAIAGCSAVSTPNGVTNGEYTGFLEGVKVDVATEVGGLITSVAVEEGNSVQAGQNVVTLEDDLIQSRIAIADANVASAKAQLALLEAGARSEDIRRGQAQVDQARAALLAATQALTDTQAIRANPQALVIAHAQADTRAKAAAQQLLAAQNLASSADQMNKFWEEQTRMLWEGFDLKFPNGASFHADTPMSRQLLAQQEWNKAGNAAWQAWAGVQQAQANATTADAALKDLSDQLANPIALDARVNQARGGVDRAAAGLEAAQAALRTLRDGATPAQLQAARAAVDQAQAARGTLDQELAHYEVKSPNVGVVNRVYYRAGETALPGAPVIQLSVAGDLTLRIFVPMTTLGKIHLNDPIDVRVEGLENNQFAGTVNRINDQAEFTARQNQTDSERNAQLVAVEIALKNADGALKPGMPASVMFK